MSSLRKGNKNGIGQNPSYRLYQIIPLYAVIGVVPLILFLKKVTLTDPGNMYWDGLSTHYDIFAFYKMIFLLLFTVIGFLIFLFVRRDHIYDQNKKWFYIAMGIYILFILLSALTSEYKTVAFFGIRERFEGAFVLIAYIIIMFLAMNLVKEEKHIKVLFRCLLISATIISLLGALQYVGIDIFKWEVFLNLITPTSLESSGGSLQANFGSGTIFSTLYNPNYVGSYMSLLVPIILVFIIWVKKLMHKLVHMILLLIMTINWIGCDSRAGIVGGTVAIIIVAIMSRRKIMQYKIFVIAATLSLCGGLFIMNFVLDGSILNSLKRMASLESKEAVNESKTKLANVIDGLDDIYISNEKIKLVTNKGTLQVISFNGELVFLDENGAELAFNMEDNIISYMDSRFVHIKLYAKPTEGKIQVYYNDYQLINIIFTKEGFKSTSNIWMTYRGDNKDIESIGIERMESFGSNRGYIWSRTIPLLKNTIFLGHGPDTFPIYFPQYDYVGKLKNYGIGGIFVDKPHNMFLQTAVNTGVISLLVVLVIFGMYFVSSIKIYFKEEFNTFLPVAGLACFAAFCGYVVAGLFNDSVVSVAPVFWTLLGLGIGINVMLTEKLSISSKVLAGKTIKKEK